MASNAAGPCTTILAVTRSCMDWSGLIQGPPAPHHPGPAARAICRPRRSAFENAWPRSSCHGSLMNSTGPGAIPRPTSRKMAPPSPACFMASKIRVDPRASQMAVHEIPVDPGARSVWRRDKLANCCVQILRLKAQQLLRHSHSGRPKSGRFQNISPAYCAFHEAPGYISLRPPMLTPPSQSKQNPLLKSKRAFLPRVQDRSGDWG